MEPQMTGPEWWYYYETLQAGTTWVLADHFSIEQLTEELGEDLVGSIGITAGFGVRRSAPGYLDCTDWEVFGDEGDAEAALYEMHDEDKEMQDEAESCQGPPPGSRYAPLVASDYD